MISQVFDVHVVIVVIVHVVVVIAIVVITLNDIFYRCSMCMRMLPSFEFTGPMLLDRSIASCTLCIKVGGVGGAKV